VINGFRACALAATAALSLAPGAASAAIDLSGQYNATPHEDGLERGAGPDAGDYAGVPINAQARLRANTWNASLITMPERQCIPHPSPYQNRSVGFLRMWQLRDDATQQILGYETQQGAFLSRRVIWTDGRPHPPETEPHTFQGFSTGIWEGDTLVVTTTHLKPSFVRRNGIPMSDRATMVERFIRHGDSLLLITQLSDPVYLTEPFIRTTNMRVAQTPTERPYPCRPAVEVPRAKGEVPHNAWGDLTDSLEYASENGLSLEAVQGGAETALPEFMDKARAAPKAAVAKR
jgi:hypothetical protein